MPTQPLNTDAIEARLAAYEKSLTPEAAHQAWVEALHDLQKNAPADLRALLDEVRELRELVEGAYTEGYIAGCANSRSYIDSGVARDWNADWLTSTARARLQGDA